MLGNTMPGDPFVLGNESEKVLVPEGEFSDSGRLDLGNVNDYVGIQHNFGHPLLSNDDAVGDFPKDEFPLVDCEHLAARLLTAAPIPDASNMYFPEIPCAGASAVMTFFAPKSRNSSVSAARTIKSVTHVQEGIPGASG